MGFRPSFYLLLILICAILLLSLATYFNINSNEDWSYEEDTKSKTAQRQTDKFHQEMSRSLPVSLLSYNIWFDLRESEERMKALSDLIMKLKPDFIALQEVTEYNLQVIKKHPWFSLYNNYFSRENFEENYFVAVFALKSYTVTNWKALPTFKSSLMERNLLWIDSLIGVFDNNQGTSRKLNFVLGTSHLESLSTLSSSKRREEQLNDVLVNQLNSFSDVCFTGDTNLDNVDGVITLPGMWKDMWLESGKTDSQGYTWDGSINHYIKDSPQKARYDRIFCKLKNFKLGEIRIVGNEPRIMNGNKIFPSDHFGIFATFVPLEHPVGDIVQGPQSVKFERDSTEPH